MDIQDSNDKFNLLLENNPGVERVQMDEYLEEDVERDFTMIQ